MKYVKAQLGQVTSYSISQMKRDNPSVSFPQHPSEELLAQYDVFPLTVLNQPVVNSPHKAVPRAPELVDGQWITGWDIETMPISVGMVREERDRRLAADFAFDGKLYQRDAVSLARITGAATLAGFARAAGAQPGDYRWHGKPYDFAWIASDNSLTLMDAHTMFEFGQTAASVETEIVFAAKALREMDPIPEDYQMDTYWPDTATP